MDKGGTAKKSVGRTDAGVDGYCPLATYLGASGFCLEVALRPGAQHSAHESFTARLHLRLEGRARSADPDWARRFCPTRA